MKHISALLVAMGSILSIYGQPSIPLASWMAHFAPQIKSRTLTEIFIPGSHDSATYKLEYHIGKGQDLPKGLDVITGPIGVGPFLKKWSQAQSESVLTQLEQGIRYLDLRVIYRDSKKQFYTVHGLYGPSLTDILGQVTQFIEQNPQEIIIIQVGDLRYMPHGDQDHHDLIAILQNAFSDKLIPKSMGVHTPIGTLWEQGKRVVLIYDKEAIANQYDTIFSDESIDSYWANKNAVGELKKRLTERLSERQSRRDQLYVIQSQLTADGDSILKSFVPFSKSFNSLKDMANAIKQELPSMLTEWAKYGPAIIQLDFVDKGTGEMIVKLNENLPAKQEESAVEDTAG